MYNAGEAESATGSSPRTRLPGAHFATYDASGAISALTIALFSPRLSERSKICGPRWPRSCRATMSKRAHSAVEADVAALKSQTAAGASSDDDADHRRTSTSSPSGGDASIPPTTDTGTTTAPARLWRRRGGNDEEPATSEEPQPTVSAGRAGEPGADPAPAQSQSRQRPTQTLRTGNGRTPHRHGIAWFVCHAGAQTTKKDA